MSTPRRVCLPDEANERLDRLKANTGRTISDVVDRSLALYEVALYHAKNGELLIRDAAGPDVKVML
ncbi:MAG: hypothetical protein COA38_20490 [Fluviicola sp.]|nr:MAG: hypothetical protein COA38_20490 [Fluviicola sp.]